MSKFAFLNNYGERHGGSSYNMNNKSRSPVSPGGSSSGRSTSGSGDLRFLPRHANKNMNLPNGHVSNINTGAYCGNTDRMPNLSKTNFEREVQRRFTNKRDNMSNAERYEIEKRIDKKLNLKFN